MAAPVKLRKEDVEEHYIRQGKTISETARFFMVSCETVIRCLRRHGIKSRKRTISKQCKDASRRRLFKGFGEISSTYLCGVRRNADARGLEMLVTPEYLWNLFLAQDRRCALSGRQLKFSSVYSTLHLKEQTASLDRIDSKRGYIPGNVQWIHKELQRMKWDFPDEVFVQACKDVVHYQQEKELDKF